MQYDRKEQATPNALSGRTHTAFVAAAEVHVHHQVHAPHEMCDELNSILEELGASVQTHNHRQLGLDPPDVFPDTVMAWVQTSPTVPFEIDEHIQFDISDRRQPAVSESLVATQGSSM